MEAWRRALDGPVSAFPIEKAGPAHIATLKTFDPPLAALEGQRLAGARRRAKRLLFPTEDGDLVLLVHLMTAGRLRYLQAGEKGPKTPAFRLGFEGGAQLVLTEAGSKKRAGVWLLTPEAASGVKSQTPARFFDPASVSTSSAPPSNLSRKAGVFGPFSPAWR